MKMCSISGCSGSVRARGWCPGHYERWRQFGDLKSTVPLHNFRHSSTCSVESCSRPYLAKGWCGKHYQNWQRTGEPVCDPTDPVTRIMRKVVVQDLGYTSPCWISGHAKNNYGYAFIRLRDRSRPCVHRVMYEARVGPIPAGYEVDHLCFNPACCNPEHLEAVTPSVNIQRSWARRKAIA